MGLNRPFDRQFFVRSVKSTGGSLSLAKGQMAVVDVTSSSETGAAIVSAFAGYPKDEKRFAIRAGRTNKEANRSYSDKGLSTATFSLNEIKKLTATAPTRTEQIMDEVVIGYDGFNADSAFKFKKGQAPFRFWLHLSGGLLQYRGGGVSEEEIMEFVKEVPGCDPYENCEDCDECEPVDCRTFVTELIETMRNREVSGGMKVSEFVDITPVFECSENPEVDTDEMTYFTLSVCDTGDDEALNLVQAQYDFPVIRINRVGSTSTYQVLATAAPDDYEQTIGSILKGCADCPDGWDAVVGGYVYAITIEDNGTNYTTQITGALASAKYVANTLVKSGNNAGVGFYTAVYNAPITQAEIASFVGVTTNNRNTATVAFVGEKQAICENDTVTETSWVEGDSCEVTTREYSIVLKDNECGDDRLAELQASYPSALSIAIGERIDSYSVEATIGSDAGAGTITIGGEDYIITFSTNPTTTGNNFVTAHGAALLAEGITVTNNAGVLTFTAETAELLEDASFVVTGEADFDVVFGEVEPDIVDDRKACQTRYVATVVTNMVCEECDPVFVDFWTASAPEPYGQAAWYLSPGQEEINKGGNCLCGIRIKGKPFVLSGNEAIWDYVQFTETSTKIQAAAGYNNLEIREAIGHLSKADYSGRHLTRFAPRTHLMGNMRDLERQSRAYFLGEAYRYDYLGRILRAEEAVIQDNFQQMAQIMLEVRHENYSQGLGGRHSNNNLYHFYVPFGQHQPVVDLLNNLAAAAGVATIQL
jgi:hypothetical protein